MEIFIENFLIVAQLCVEIPRAINYLCDDFVDDWVRVFRTLSLLIKLVTTDQVCTDNTDRNFFDSSCRMLRDFGTLRGNRNMDMGEMVTLFLYSLLTCT